MGEENKIGILECPCGRKFEEEKSYTAHIKNCQVYQSDIIVRTQDAARALLIEQETLTPEPTPEPTPAHALNAIEPEEIDFSAFRLDNNNPLSTIRLFTEVRIRRPKRFEFFRVHEGDDWMFSAQMLVMEEGMDTVQYLVVPELHTGLAKHLREIILYAAINQDGVIFLVDVPLREKSGRRNHWSASLMENLEMAKTRWIQSQSDQDVSAYVPYFPISDLGEPQWPDTVVNRKGKEVEMSMQVLLEAHFREDNIIRGVSHPVIKKILGVKEEGMQ